MRLLPTLVTLLCTGALIAQSPLTTTFANNNLNANGGMVFFDLDVTFPGGVQIYQMDINTTAGSGGIEVWTVPTTWVGNEATAGNWTSAGIATFTSGAGAGNPTQCCFGTGFYLPAGQYGVAIAQDPTTNQTYTNGPMPLNTFSTNELTLIAGASSNTQFSGAQFNPRIWNGNIYYELGPQPGTCGVPASKQTYGSGCGTPALGLDSNNPSLGNNWDLTTSNIDAVSPFAITFFGDRGPAVSFSVIGLDAPGCDVNLSSILVDGTGPNVAGSATVSVPIPNDPTLSGGMLSAQSICLTLSNNANLLSSNGVEGTFGL